MRFHAIKKALLGLAVALFLGCWTWNGTAQVEKSAGGRANQAQAPASDAAPEDINQLSLQVEVLQVLDGFKFTATQMESLAKQTKSLNLRAAPREVGKASDEYRTALLALREALVKAEDSKQIQKLKSELDELHEQEDPDLDDDVEITDAARRLVPEVLRSLSVRQISAYLESHTYELPDPFELLVDALDEVGNLSDSEWKDLRDEVVEEVGWLLAGLDKRKAQLVGTQVDRWLKQVRSLNEKDRARRRPELEKSARQMIDTVPPTVVLTHIVEHTLAELLSNPQLPSALAARAPK